MINGDYDKTDDDHGIRVNRIQQVMNGVVAAEEAAADAFAVQHCGKSTVIAMLDYVIQKRKQRNTMDGMIAIRELELRKNAVKRL